MMWMNLEPITQNEVSQKEKEKYILAYLYGIQKDGIDEFIYREAVGKQTQRTDLSSGGEEGEGEIYGERQMETYITTCKIDTHW